MRVAMFAAVHHVSVFSISKPIVNIRMPHKFAEIRVGCRRAVVREHIVRPPATEACQRAGNKGRQMAQATLVGSRHVARTLRTALGDRGVLEVLTAPLSAIGFTVKRQQPQEPLRDVLLSKPSVHPPVVSRLITYRSVQNSTRIAESAARVVLAFGTMRRTERGA